jgi:hypothetical protein
MPKFCYWSVADGQHANMMACTIASARKAGVQEDFHIWSDLDIPGAITHKIGKYDKSHYIFKLTFLRDEVSKLDYDYFVFLDADCYFVRHPGDFTDLLRDNKWFVQMENDCTSRFVKRGDWWGCPTKTYNLLIRYFLRDHGVEAKTIYNTNAGFWIVRKEAIVEFTSLALGFFQYSRNEMGLTRFTEEAPIAFVGHLVDDPAKNSLAMTSDTWASDWTGQYKNRLPDGKIWTFENYMTSERLKCNPAIVHAMRSKDTMVAIGKKLMSPENFPALKLADKPLVPDA